MRKIYLFEIKNKVVPHQLKSIVVKINSPLEKTVIPLKHIANNNWKNCTKMFLSCWVTNLKFKYNFACNINKDNTSIKVIIEIVIVNTQWQEQKSSV